MEYIRKLGLGYDKEILERIKWNNPSFYYARAMKDFDHKEYKRELALFNLSKKNPSCWCFRVVLSLRPIRA